MAGNELFYSRRVSSEESTEGYVFVEKAKLAFFPLPGQPFDLAQGPAVRKVKVESYHCTCRGPELPHEHYFIRWANVKKGDTVMIRRDSRKAGRYTLQIRSTTGQSGLCG